jgi:hypothetical protein
VLERVILQAASVRKVGSGGRECHIRRGDFGGCELALSVFGAANIRTRGSSGREYNEGGLCKVGALGKTFCRSRVL